MKILTCLFALVAGLGMAAPSQASGGDGRRSVDSVPSDPCAGDCAEAEHAPGAVGPVLAEASPCRDATTHFLDIDLTALTNRQSLLVDITAPVVSIPLLDGTVVQTLELEEGYYILQPGSGQVMSCTLQVTTAGLWDFPADCDAFLSGRGTATLVVNGFQVLLDATALSNTQLAMLSFSVPLLDTNVVQAMTLMPIVSGYGLQPGSGLVCALDFGIDHDGRITYDPVHDAWLSGRGTNRLVMHGFPVSIDARALSNPIFVLTDIFGLTSAPGFDSSVVQSFTLPPAGRMYMFQVGSGTYNVATLRWEVREDGLIDYDHVFDSYLSGRGTSTLVVRGHTVEIDATALGAGRFWLSDMFGGGPFDSLLVHSFTLVPTPFYRFEDGPIAFFWSLRENGTIDFDPALDACVQGRGTNRLTVLCNPALPPTPEELIGRLKATVASLPASVFRHSSPRLRAALIHKLGAVLADIEAARAQPDPLIQDAILQGALDKLHDDILAKMDGCAVMGAPDANDWIVDCSVQADLTSQVQQITVVILAWMTSN